MNSEIRQTITERIDLYVTKVSEAQAYTMDKFEAINGFYQYLLTPDVKVILSGEDAVKSREVLLRKTEEYMDELEARYWVCQAFPYHGETLEEMIKFLKNAQPLRRSERVREQVVGKFNQSFKPHHKEIKDADEVKVADEIKVYAELTANIARMAELKGEGNRRPQITVKVLPRRSARLLKE
jgi:molybdopterin converting factor small subunit